LSFQGRRNGNDTQIEATYAGEAYSARSQGEVWDPLSVLLALRRDFDPARSEYHYKVVYRDGVRDYEFRYLGEERIEVDDTRYDTVVLQRDHGRRTTRVWLAPSRDLVPVRIQQDKDGERDTRMNLLSFSRDVE
jgi:hypothetical protein